MRVRSIIVAAFLVPVGVSCGRNNPETSVPQDIAAARSAGRADVTQGYGNAVGLVGVWELRSTPPQRFPGLQIAIRVDSVAGSRYFGSLASYFSGDVGQNPDDFEVFTDSLLSDSTVKFSIQAVDHEMPGILFGGTLGTDTITLRTLVLGPDTVNTRARRWFLVRRD